MKEIYSALMGIFDEKGQPSEQGVFDVVRHNIDFCGVDGLYVNGSTGESFLMNLDKRRTMLRLAATAAKGDVKLIAHIGSNAVDEVHLLANEAAELGYDAVSAVTPFYYKFSAEEIKKYYKELAAASPLPLIIYYIPLLAGARLGADDLRELLETPNVCGVKFTEADFFLLERIRTACPQTKIYSGFDEMLLSACVLGTDGAIGSTYNIIGAWAKKLAALTDSSDYDSARKVQTKMNGVIDALIKAGLYPTIKETLALYGCRSGRCLPPMGETTQKHRDAAAEIKRIIDSESGLML